MKSFGSKPWMLPQPVLIIGTYNENHKYIQAGKVIGEAFSCGKELK